MEAAIGEMLFIDISYEETVDKLEADSTLPCSPVTNFEFDTCLDMGIGR